MNPAAIMFDMDGLLLDTEKVCLDSFVETRRAFSLPDNPEAFLRCVGLRGEEPDRIILESLCNRVDYSSFNLEWDRQIETRLNQVIPLRPGAARLVKILAAKGYPMGVATSTQTDRARRQLDRSGLLRYMHCVVGGDLVSKHKPDPEVYHRVAHILGADASRCVAFEDSETGTRAAVASGAFTIQVPDLVPPSDELRKLGHVVATSLLEGAMDIGIISAADL